MVQQLVLLESGVGGGAEDLPAQLGSWFASWPVPFPSAGGCKAFRRNAHGRRVGARPARARGRVLAPLRRCRDAGRYDRRVQVPRWTEWQ